MREDYLLQIQAAVDYVEAHVDEELSLSRLAQVAGFSDYHFHRVFQSMAGDTVMEYVRKRRLARAANGNHSPYWCEIARLEIVTEMRDAIPRKTTSTDGSLHK